MWIIAWNLLTPFHDATNLPCWNNKFAAKIENLFYLFSFCLVGLSFIDTQHFKIWFAIFSSSSFPVLQKLLYELRSTDGTYIFAAKVIQKWLCEIEIWESEKKKIWFKKSNYENVRKLTKWWNCCSGKSAREKCGKRNCKHICWLVDWLIDSVVRSFWKSISFHVNWLSAFGAEMLSNRVEFSSSAHNNNNKS